MYMYFKEDKLVAMKKQGRTNGDNLMEMEEKQSQYCDQ